jgi:Protein of unknown function (DUF2975)
LLINKGLHLMLKKTVTLLKVLNVLNWGITAVFVLIVALISLSSEAVIIQLTKSYPVETAKLMIQSTQWIMLLIIPVTYAAHRIFRSTQAILRSAIAGDPFVKSNAVLLRIIGWALLAIQIFDLAGGLVMVRFSDATGIYWGWSPALTGWLAALLMFVLAGIFERGAAMREELEGTV